MIIDVKQTTAIFKISIKFNIVPWKCFIQWNGIIPVDQIEFNMEYNHLTVYINHCVSFFMKIRLLICVYFLVFPLKCTFRVFTNTKLKNNNIRMISKKIIQEKILFFIDYNMLGTFDSILISMYYVFSVE